MRSDALQCEHKQRITLIKTWMRLGVGTFRDLGGKHYNLMQRKFAFIAFWSIAVRQENYWGHDLCTVSASTMRICIWMCVCMHAAIN